ncbi:spore protease YyaC [Metabacillus endolithicus]|uniref:Spore protease YyaC n=1 Tax=Metabacillus endolithicus TaxID=1535204 RepID=A0ABW5BZF2_9BACI|nr:spore protease YyaC [Metabacillus endolithicus]UPG61696.1 spore protease YyaC [Metabacillus endolithicus]
MNLKSGLFHSDKNQERIHYEDQDATQLVSTTLLDHLPKLYFKPIVFVCIGTDRSTGDSLGPLIGTSLNKELSHFHVYGTLKDPVHAVNLKETLETINEKHRNPFIIAIDACLGRMKSVGFMEIAKGSIKPGAGVNKELPAVGDMHITGIVNISGYMEFLVLQNTRLHLVMSMADIISNGIIEAEKIYLEKKISVRRKWLASEDSAIN